MIAGRRVLALVPARGGSKGLPGKNLLPLCGRPLLAWTAAAARASRWIDACVLSTDDDGILSAGLSLGLDAPFKRPDALARDDTPAIDVVFHALDNLPGFDILLLLQPTSPLRTAADIDAALGAMVSAGAPSIVSLRPAQDHPAWTFQLSGTTDTLAPFVVDPTIRSATRRQDLPPAWCLNGALYAADVTWLREHRSFIGPETMGYTMPAERSVDIDDASDLARAEHILSART